MSNRRDMLFSFGETLKLTFINNHTTETMAIAFNGQSVDGSQFVGSGTTRKDTIFDHYTEITVYPAFTSLTTRINGVLGQNFVIWRRDGGPTTVPIPADLIYTCTNA